MGITEAPRVELGAPGVEQSLPVATKAPGQIPEAGRTTIEDLREFLEVPEPVIEEQIQRLYLNLRIPATLRASSSVDPGQTTGELSPAWEKRSDSLIAGDNASFVEGRGWKAGRRSVSGGEGGEGGDPARAVAC